MHATNDAWVWWEAAGVLAGCAGRAGRVMEQWEWRGSGERRGRAAWDLSVRAAEPLPLQTGRSNNLMVGAGWEGSVTPAQPQITQGICCHQNLERNLWTATQQPCRLAEPREEGAIYLLFMRPFRYTIVTVTMPRCPLFAEVGDKTLS